MKELGEKLESFKLYLQDSVFSIETINLVLDLYGKEILILLAQKKGFSEIQETIKGLIDSRVKVYGEVISEEYNKAVQEDLLEQLLQVVDKEFEEAEINKNELIEDYTRRLKELQD